MNYLFNLLTLNKIKGLGPLTIRQLTAHVPENQMEIFLTEVNLTTLLNSKFKEVYLCQLKSGLQKQIEREIEFCIQHRIRIIPYWSQEFPYRLKQVNDHPNFIYVRGEPPLNPSKTIALVGTRKPSPLTLKWTSQFMDDIFDDSIQIISGLAYGIDIHVHRKALNLSQSTLAVLAHGLDRIYPQIHKTTAHEMLLHQGGLISEMPLGTELHPDLFPRRNRLIAALSDAVIVVESKVTGGSMSTAQLAHHYNRDVFAVPSLPNASSGCNALIKRNIAQLIESGKDFKQAMGWGSKYRSNNLTLFSDLSESQQKIIQSWPTQNHNQTVHFDEIYQKSGLKLSQLPQHLLELELQGKIMSMGQNHYKLTTSIQC